MLTKASDVIVAQREPREEQVEDLVEEFDVDPEFASKGVRGAVEVAEFDDRVERGEEGAVEPSPTLGDQLRDLFARCERIVSEDGMGWVAGPIFQIPISCNCLQSQLLRKNSGLSASFA